MLKKHPILAVFVLICVIILGVYDNVYAESPTVELIIEPDIKTIPASSAPISITVLATGSTLTFDWKLAGSGRLVGDTTGYAVLYIPPEQIDRRSTRAVISVRVSDYKNQTATESVSFTIISSSQQTPVTTEMFSESRGIGTGTKIALGAGTIAAIGGGIALISLTEDDSSNDNGCGGIEIGGYCWYLGAQGQSCDNVCASHGGYHEATRTYAGSEGTSQNCYHILEALGAPPDSDGKLPAMDSIDSGCYSDWFGTTSVFWQRGTLPTTSSSRDSARQRACACNR